MLHTYNDTKFTLCNYENSTVIEFDILVELC
jgi:hypothetical protein